jgi:hypothetical protein
MLICSVLLQFRIFYGNLLYLFCSHFGIFFSVLVCCTKKNLATLEKCWQKGAEKIIRQKLSIRKYSQKNRTKEKCPLAG